MMEMTISNHVSLQVVRHNSICVKGKRYLIPAICVHADRTGAGFQVLQKTAKEKHQSILRARSLEETRFGDSPRFEETPTYETPPL